MTADVSRLRLLLVSVAGWINRHQQDVIEYLYLLKSRPSRLICIPRPDPLLGRSWSDGWEFSLGTEKLCSHAPRVGVGELGIAAATRRVEGAPATGTADADGPDLLGSPIAAVDTLAAY